MIVHKRSIYVKTVYKGFFFNVAMLVNCWVTVVLCGLGTFDLHATFLYNGCILKYRYFYGKTN